MATTETKGRTRRSGPKAAPGRMLSAASVVPAAGLPKHCRLKIAGDQGTLDLTNGRTALMYALWDAINEGGVLRISIKLEVDVLRELKDQLEALGLPSTQEV